MSDEERGGSQSREASDALAAALRTCRAGDRAGLRAIFDSEAARLVRSAERILRRRDLAEEIVQEAFIVIWTKAHQYEPERGSARGWIYAIVRSRALNALRDGAREDLASDETLAEIAGAEETQQADLVWSQLDAASRLRECLEGLDETKRRCIVMAYVSGYTHGEIAGRLEAPLGSVKAWIRRGLATLRECMA